MAKVLHIGRSPVRFTKFYLESSNLFLRDNIRAVVFNVVPNQPHSEGLAAFDFWHTCQLQYRNPNVQLVKLNGVTPTPFVMTFHEDGSKEIVDCFGKSRTEIRHHIRKIFGKTDAEIADFMQSKDEQEKRRSHPPQNPANVGLGCDRWCICEIPGQQPCSGFERPPKERTGKFKYHGVDRDAGSN